MKLLSLPCGRESKQYAPYIKPAGKPQQSTEPQITEAAGRGHRDDTPAGQVLRDLPIFGDAQLTSLQSKKPDEETLLMSYPVKQIFSKKDLLLGAFSPKKIV